MTAKPSRPRLSIVRQLWMCVQLIAFVTYIFCISITMLVFVPLRLLHRPLRKLGVKSNYLPLDYLSVLWGRTFMTAVGCNVLVEGKENMDTQNPSVAMYSHVSNLDPFILMAHCGVVPKLVGKKIVYMIPLFGWAGLGYGHIAIDRSNQKKAIKSLDLAEEYCRKWQRTVMIAPEGTRSKTGELQEFKKGPFQVAHHLKIKVTPIVLFNAWSLWPPGQVTFFLLTVAFLLAAELLLSVPGTMVMRILPPIAYDADATLEARMQQVHKAMEDAIENPPSEDKIKKFTESRGWFFALHYVFNAFFLVVFYLGFRRFIY